MLLILGSTLTVIAMTAIVTYLLVRERADAAQAAARAASNIVQLIDADVLRNVELYDQAVKGLIEASQRPDLAGIPPDVRHLALFDRASSASHRGDVLLLDRQGDVIADSLSVTPRVANFSDREYFQIHKDNPDPKLTITGPFKARRAPHFWLLGFSRRLSTPDGEFLGVATAALRLSYFDELFKSLDIGKGSSVNLISAQGILLAQQPHMGEDLIGKDFSKRPNFLRIMKEGEGSFTGISSLDGTERLYTFAKVGKLPLIVVVALSTDGVYAAWRHTASLIGLATGILCFILLWLTWLLSRELRLRQRAEKALAKLATTDPLTGLANRRALDDALLREWARARRSGKPLSLLMIDADHFKAFNDRHGHPVGDEALKRLARVISDSIRRPGDIAARYGGEEFSVILPETDAQGALSQAQKIRTAMAALPPFGDDSQTITVSIGVSTTSQLCEGSVEQLLHTADRALYQAKHDGRDRALHIPVGG
ncbi:sensor domain-containing diguanylate cyclase [Pseudomonas gingeri NCPPB 3146 = LMG 5327]|uniref:diguanylate cyclase n=2 Tax=Pseudomonas gingeri TaxID=117681 RepID=A0A7Y7Y3F7_9PSED|nr:diguanylate cyclase [Pseudomonas gingeri]NWC17116.1 diguanylate cyclase [Pseudomonas gingeri]PNQ92052.1 sensor domain-containing diguanylate cyclase [Pseudomonas gingeri NCPPB 3146 = LMG 5327]